MKFIERIFLVIFFGSMLVTVFNYLPVIEEEVCSKKHSQSQTSKNTEGGEPGTEDEGGSGCEDLFHAPYGLSITVTEATAEKKRQIDDRFYPPLPRTCPTPPRLAA